MPKNFNVFRQVVLGYVLIVGLSIGLITPIAQAEAPTDTLYSASATSQVVDGLNQIQRAEKIEAFYQQEGNLPLAQYSLDMVQAADADGIDWRLVPAIAINESTGGLDACKTASYNAFGYDGCHISFKSYPDAIARVTADLAGMIPATAKAYAGKTLTQKIDTYNPPYANENYERNVLWTMNKIAEADTSSFVATTTSGSQLAVN